jgi:hypothetical protein
VTIRGEQVSLNPAGTTDQVVVCANEIIIAGHRIVL